ncbi:hypothetical protein BGW38_001514 [Lunasporangiospora selenospora]|uniref:Uncharacterized protein n=1 Tax=Lunasporangiospora selenospora TaxID=979761 RepID=A0A9P6KDG8_9FUNG|nr:hypothetical protein BGW38_001514 [Lunasporangiospora selenospora]
MKFSLKVAAIGALLASAVVAAPVEVEKRDAVSDRIGTCFIGLLFTGSWPSRCQAAVAVNLGLIRSITINQMSMDFTTADPYVPNTSSNSVVATMLSIPGITLPIDSVKQHIILVDGGVQIGHIETPWSAASVKGGTLTTAFSSSPLTVFKDSKEAFSKFVGSLSTKPSHPVTLQGAVDVKLNLGIFGKLTIPGIGFKATTSFAGLNHLSPVKFLYLIELLPNTPEKRIDIAVVVNIVNPSKLTVNLGDVSFDTSSPKGRIGVSKLKGLSLVPGDNFVLSQTTLDLNEPASADFLTDINTMDIPLTLAGFSGSSLNPALNGGLAGIRTLLTVPRGYAGTTLSQAPYKGWSLKVLPTTVTDLIVEISATFQSPYYGLPVEVVLDQIPGTNNRARVANLSNLANGVGLFHFIGDLKVAVDGKGSKTVTFKAKLKRTPFSKSEKTRWTEIVNFGIANKYVEATLDWSLNVILNNDGVTRQVDWSTTGANLPNNKIAVGADFATILNAFPA